MNEVISLIQSTEKKREIMPLFLSVLRPPLAQHNLKDRQLIHSEVQDHQRMLMGISRHASYL